MRTKGPGVLRYAGDAELSGDGVTMQTHLTLLLRAEETVADHRVFQHPIAKAVSETRFSQQIRRVAHALHTAGDHHFVLARANQQIGERDRPHSGAANAVDRL